MGGEHGRGGKEVQAGEQPHSVPQDGCPPCPSPTPDLAQGPCWALRSLVRGAGPCPRAVGKPATAPAPPPGGSCQVPARRPG